MELIYKRSASRVRLAKVPAQYRRLVRPSSQASCCSCSNIVIATISRLASFAEVGFVCGKASLFVWLMRNRVARWVGLPPGDGSIRRVRSAKTPCAVSRPLRPNSPASCCSCSNIVFTMISPLASFAEVGFVCGKHHHPLGSFGGCVGQLAMDLSVGFVWPKQEGSCPTAAFLRPHGRLARSVNSATVEASAREAAEKAERYEAKPIT
jgi:hypothetical protein